MPRPKKKPRGKRLSAEKPPPARPNGPALLLGASRRVGRWLWTGFFFVFAVVAIGFPTPPLLRPGDIALRDYVAGADFNVVDGPATEQLRQEKERKTWRVFNDRPAAMLALPDKALDALRETQAAAGRGGSEPERLKRWVPAKDVPVLARGLTPKLMEGLARELRGFCKLAASRGVMSQKSRQREIQEFSRFKILVPERGKSLDRPGVVDILHETIEYPGRFREMLEERLRRIFTKKDSDRFRRALTDLIVRMAEPSLEYNDAETRRFVWDAKAAVKPVQRKVSAGSRLVWRGEVISPQQVYEVRASYAKSPGYFTTGVGEVFVSGWRRFAGVLGVVLGVFCGAGVFVVGANRELARSNTRFATAGCLLVASLLIARLTITWGISPYWTPVLLFAVLQTLMFGRAVGLGLTGILCLLLLLMFRGGYTVVLGLFLGGATGVAYCSRLRRRTQLIEAGLLAGVVQFAAVWALGQLRWSDVLPSSGRLLKDSLLSLGMGATIGFLLSGLLPYIERLLELVTDLSLAEWSDRNQPLLRRLAMEAPGSHHHSLMVGALAEAAAEAINGNALLARAGGYFHDVGKLAKPEYFIENTEGRPSPHVGLSPMLSTLIITSHPRDGSELAEEYGLPAQLRHIIAQHHGTSVVEFFYNEALRDATEPDQVDREMFRYRGPRPTSKESAIVLLADSVEPAARSLSDPTPARLEGLVRDITRRRLFDGQLDEAELTFADVRLIEESLIRNLLALFHHRIKYPEPTAPNQRGRNSSS